MAQVVELFQSRNASSSTGSDRSDTARQLFLTRKTPQLALNKIVVEVA